jgi:hypothetical protein
MQATITFRLTESAQRAQMVSTGQPVARTQTMIEEIPVELLNSPLAKIDSDGKITFDLAVYIALDREGNINNSNTWTRISPEFDAIPTSGVAAVQSRMVQITETQAKLQKEYQLHLIALREDNERRAAEQRLLVDKSVDTILCDASFRLRDLDYSQNAHGILLRLPDETHPRYAELIAVLKNRDEQHHAEQMAIEAEKVEFIGSWIANHGDEELCDQFEAELVCRKTVIRMIADEAFSAAGVPNEVTVPDTCNHRECPCCDTSVDCLPTKVYRVWRRIQATLPEDGHDVKFSKVRECLRNSENWDGTGDSALPAYYTATISIARGPFTFTRRVKL